MQGRARQSAQGYAIQEILVSSPGEIMYGPAIKHPPRPLTSRCVDHYLLLSFLLYEHNTLQDLSVSRALRSTTGTQLPTAGAKHVFNSPGRAKQILCVDNNLQAEREPNTKTYKVCQTAPVASKSSARNTNKHIALTRNY